MLLLLLRVLLSTTSCATYALNAYHLPHTAELLASVTVPLLHHNNAMLLKASSTGARLARLPSCRLLCGRCSAVVPRRASAAIPASSALVKGVAAPVHSFAAISRGMADSTAVPKAAAVQEVDTVDVFTTNPLLAVSNSVQKLYTV